jgi:hypothetical protein
LALSEDVGTERVVDRDMAHRKFGTGELFDHDADVHGGGSNTSLVLGQIHAENAQLAETLIDLHRNGTVPIDVATAGLYLPFSETPHHPTEFFLLV